MIAVNTTKNTILAKKVWVAKNFKERMRGLITHPPLETGEALLIPSCKGIHTFGMSYPIDVIYMDERGRVVSIVPSISKNLFGPINFRTHSVLELPAGVIEQTKTQQRDLISISGAEEVVPFSEKIALKIDPLSVILPGKASI